MRKKVFGRQLSRSTKSRKALFRGLMKSLIQYGKIETTETKAKSILPEIDGLINFAKEGSTASMRRLYGILGNDKAAVKKLTEETKLFKSRNSGYTRITKLGFRRGDGAQMVRLAWVKDEIIEKKKEKTKKRALVKKKVK